MAHLRVDGLEQRAGAQFRTIISFRDERRQGAVVDEIEIQMAREVRGGDGDGPAGAVEEFAHEFVGRDGAFFGGEGEERDDGREAARQGCAEGGLETLLQGALQGFDGELQLGVLGLVR